MKMKFSLFLLAACILLLAGCSSTSSKIDTGPITARTFSFVNIKGKPIPDYAEREQQVHALVQNAITQSLARRQVQRVAQGGDVTVAYLVIVGNNAETASINDYFGYGKDADKLAEIAHTKYTDNKNPNYFEAGTLLIDFIDPRTYKVLKRGYASRALQPNLAPEARAARVSEVVEEILAGLRFKQ
jgi:hypothetical protein